MKEIKKKKRLEIFLLKFYENRCFSRAKICFWHMTTLSWPPFDAESIFEIKKKYHNGQRYSISAIQLDTSYLRWPNHLSVRILEEEHKELILEAAKKALYYGQKEFSHEAYGFTNVEIQKIKRIYDYSKAHSALYDKEKNREDFVIFVDELDKRRGTNFLETFPKLDKMYAKYK